MRTIFALAFTPLIPLAGAALAHAPQLMSAADQFHRECAVTRNARLDLTRQFHATITGATARLPAATWRSMRADQRQTVFWSLAYAASCAQGRRSDHRVQVVDPAGRELAHQRISTRVECHGDHAIIRPDDIEYLC